MDPLPKDGESAAAGEPSRGAGSSSGVVVQVREKKGPLRAAIPYMPFPVAVICLFLNTFVPGLAARYLTLLLSELWSLPDHLKCEQVSLPSLMPSVLIKIEDKRSGQ